MELHFKPNDKNRKQMVAAIEQVLGIKSKYLRVPTCAYEIGGYTVSKDGSLTIPEDADLAESSRVIDACVMAGFEPEEWEQNGTEEKTTKPSAEAPETADSGLTVAMPRDTFTDEQLANLRKLTESKANLIRKALKTDELPILDDGQTVSFPWIPYEPSAEECRAVACLIDAMCKLAREATRVTAKEKEYDNDKYAFRCFLLRLGMIGDEYKQIRKTLLKELTGSSAFKSGKKGGEQ